SLAVAGAKRGQPGRAELIATNRCELSTSKQTVIMIDLLYRHLLIPAFESGFKRRKTFGYWRQLEKSQWLSLDELRSLQLTALHKLLAHASTSCPYYRDAWEAHGLDSRGVRS